MESIRSTIGVSLSVRIQQVRSLLERMHSECDECYCYDCYKDVHCGGKRANHAWVGFKEYAPSCPVCKRSPAKVRCFECDESYCSSCYKVLHGIGKKRKHKNMLVFEPNPLNADMCKLCKQRVSTTPCPRKNCTFEGCDSCVECVHLPECILSQPPDDQINVCAMCGDAADTKCVECGDLYCSNKWMGNIGCFAKNHSKGYRMGHRLCPHTK
jgi:hypothetical protein